MRPHISAPYKKITQRSFSPLVLVNHLLELLGRNLGLLALNLLGAKLVFRVLSGVRVETKQDLLVLERVLLLHAGALSDGTALDRSKHSLDLGAVNELAKVRLRDHGRRQKEVPLELGSLSGGAVDLVQSGERRRSPDAESAQVSTGSELEKVQGVNGACLDTGNVAESLGNVLSILLGIVDDERTTTLTVSSTSHLTLTGANLPALAHLLQITTGTDAVEERDGSGGLCDAEGG